MNQQVVTDSSATQVSGVMKDAVLCIKTQRGEKMRLSMEAPLEQRIEFFSRIFDEVDPIPGSIHCDRPRSKKAVRAKPTWRARFVRPRRTDLF